MLMASSALGHRRLEDHPTIRLTTTKVSPGSKGFACNEDVARFKGGLKKSNHNKDVAGFKGGLKKSNRNKDVAGFEGGRLQ